MTCALIVGFAASTLAQDIAFLAGDSLTSTKRTISGARRTIARQHPDANFATYFLNEQQELDTSSIDQISKSKPSLIITVGSTATEVAREKFPETPIVFSAVLYPAISGFVESLNSPDQNITGASLDIPVDIQFEKFKAIVPELKEIGVLYTDNTASLIPPARVIAHRMGLRLVAVKIENAKEIPRALDSLSGVVQGLWSVADPYLFTPQSTKFILLNCARRNLPFMGFSRNVVESGALFALDFDFKAIGKQTGAIANRVLTGTKPGEIPASTPDIIWFFYNARTAERLNRPIPAELMAIAKEVYR